MKPKAPHIVKTRKARKQSRKAVVVVLDTLSDSPVSPERAERIARVSEYLTATTKHFASKVSQHVIDIERRGGALVGRPTKHR